MKFVCLAVVLMCLSSCVESEPGASPSELAPPGQLLSQTHCASCHLVPEPTLLTKPIWKNYILVRMGAFLGIYNDTRQYYDSLPAQWIEPGYGGERIRAAHIYPDAPRLSRKEWEQIVDYYLSMAPTSARGVERQHPIYPELRGFQTEPITALESYLPYVQAIEIEQETGASYLSLYDQSERKFMTSMPMAAPTSSP